MTIEPLLERPFCRKPRFPASPQKTRWRRVRREIRGAPNYWCKAGRRATRATIALWRCLLLRRWIGVTMGDECRLTPTNNKAYKWFTKAQFWLYARGRKTRYLTVRVLKTLKTHSTPLKKKERAKREPWKTIFIAFWIWTEEWKDRSCCVFILSWLFIYLEKKLFICIFKIYR